MNLKLFLFFFAFNCCNLFSQEIGGIRLDYENGAKSNSYISISIYTLDIASTTAIVDVEIRREKSRSEISIEQYLKIQEQFLKLSSKDIVTNISYFVMDAATVNVSFTDYINTITYSAYALNKSDEISSRRNLLELVKHILEVANVKILEIN